MKSKGLSIVIMVFAALVGVPGMNLQAVSYHTVFEDHFDLVPPVAWPDPTKDADPLALTGGWAAIIEQDAGGDVLDFVQVTNNASPGSVSAAGYLVVDRTEENSFAAIWGNLSETVESANLIVEFDLYVQSATGTPEELASNGMQLFLRSNDDIAYTEAEYVIITNFNLLGWVVYFDTVSTANYLADFPLDSWVHVKYEIDTVAQTYTLQVDSAVYTDLPFVNAVSVVKQMNFYALGSKSRFYLDTVTAQSDSEYVQATIFKDDFENVPAVAFQDLTQNANPMAQVGSWFYIEEGTPFQAAIQVTDNAEPGAFEGNNYLAMYRDTGHYAALWGNPSEFVENEPNAVVISFAWWPKKNASSGGIGSGSMSFYLKNATDTGWDSYPSQYLVEGSWVDWFGNFGDPRYGYYYRNSAGTLMESGIYAYSDQWNVIRYEVNLANDSYKVVANGLASADIPFRNNLSGFKQMLLYADPGHQSYWDDIEMTIGQAVCTEHWRADINGDCKVDIADLAEIAGQWLESNL